MDSAEKRFCYRLTLQVFQDFRQKLINDTIQKSPFIRSGLHNQSESTKKLYFERYLIEWLDEHWNEMLRLLKKEQNEHSLTVNGKREYSLFFAKYFIGMIQNLQNTSFYAQLAVSDIIKIKIKSLNELLQYSQKWEENCNVLEADLQAHEDEYKQLIKKYSK